MKITRTMPCWRKGVSWLVVACLLGAAQLRGPSRAPAWGTVGHQLINEYAVENLPDAMYDDGSGNGFNAWRGYLRGRALDPDNLRGVDSQESPRHFCDIDAQPELYPPPFTAVPRDYAQYVAAFGRSNGTVMWEGIAEHADGLRIALKARNWVAARAVAADVGHYVADSHSPLHGAANFNGQLTGQNGIHARHESNMVSRYFTNADMTTRRSVPALGGSCVVVDDLVELGFSAIIESQEASVMVLGSDLLAFMADPSYGTAYYTQLFGDCGEMTRGRLNLAAQRLADVWYTAWVQAGSPEFSPTPKAAPVFEMSAETAAAALNGVMDASEFGAASTILQTNTTDHGDNSNELDQQFVALDRTGGSLRFGIAGNLGNNSALVVLLDTRPGGVAGVIPAAGPAYATGLLAGAEIDPELSPEHALFIRRTGSSYAINLADCEALTSRTLVEGPGPGLSFPGGGGFHIRTNNIRGVKDRNGRTVGDCENVRWGVEISLPAAALGIDLAAGAELRTLAFLLVTTATTPAPSNQFLPGMPLGAYAPDTGVALDFSERGHARYSIAPAQPGNHDALWLLR